MIMLAAFVLLILGVALFVVSCLTTNYATADFLFNLFIPTLILGCVVGIIALAMHS